MARKRRGDFGYVKGFKQTKFEPFKIMKLQYWVLLVVILLVIFGCQALLNK